MSRKFAVLSLLVLAMVVTGCSPQTVPPATKGKVLTTSGYSADVLQPGKYYLWGRDQLVLLQTNTATYSEKINVVLSDKLTLSAEVKFRGRIGGDKKVINSMFNDIVAGEDNLIAFKEVYSVYGRMAVRNKVREVISKYNVDDVHKNYARLSKEIAQSLTSALKSTPLEISDIALGSISYPKVVTEAINAAKEKELAVKKEQAQAEIELTKKKNERLLAEADYQIKVTNAKAVRDSNKIIGEGVTPELIELRRLDVMQEMAKSGSTIFMPVEGMTSPGAQMRMFNAK